MSRAPLALTVRSRRGPITELWHVGFAGTPKARTNPESFRPWTTGIRALDLHPASLKAVEQPRRRVDWDELRRRTAGICFICELLAGNPAFAHHVVYEDQHQIAFLNRFPVLLGHVLVAPKEHREGVTADFTAAEYLALHGVVYRIGEALREVVPTERLYVLSLGSQEANRHVHWHVAPLPPGVPFEEQQFRALDRGDILDVSDEEAARLAEKLRSTLAGEGYKLKPSSAASTSPGSVSRL